MLKKLCLKTLFVLFYFFVGQVTDLNQQKVELG